MVSENRHPSPDLKAPEDAATPDPLDLRSRGFFGAVALLERLSPDAPRVGGSESSAEAIRFKHDPSLAFSSGDLSAARLARPGRYELTTAFLGLTGGASPTPSYLSEQVLNDDEHVRGDFLDVFHHRLLSLLYRTLSRLRPWAEQTSALDDPWSNRLLALAGVDPAVLTSGDALSGRALLRLLPLLVARARPSGGLAVALAEVLAPWIDGAPVGLRELTGGWSPVETAAQTKLGVCNTKLGHDALLGRSVFDPAGAFDIRIGPTSYDVFRRFGETGASGGPLATLHALVRRWVQDPLEYRVVLILPGDQVPPLRLGEGSDSRLGRDSWIGSRSEDTALTVFPTVEMAGA